MLSGTGIIKHMLMRWILQHEHVVKDELEAFKIIEQLFQSDQYRHSAATKLSLKVLFYEVRWAAAESVADFRKTLYPTVTDIQGRFVAAPTEPETSSFSRLCAMTAKDFSMVYWHCACKVVSVKPAAALSPMLRILPLSSAAPRKVIPPMYSL
jgi:dGTP triphosphohydrolase